MYTLKLVLGFTYLWKSPKMKNKRMGPRQEGPPAQIGKKCIVRKCLIL